MGKILYLGSGLTKIDRIYETAKGDGQFREAVLTADGDKLSRLFPDIMERATVASVYYGYLVAKYGDDWHTHIK